MMQMKAATAGLIAVAALILAACGETKAEKAEVATRKKLVKLALHNPGTLTFVNEQVEETSEGDEIVLEVDYKDGDLAGHVWDKCWFAGYGEEKRLKGVSYRDSQTAEYTNIAAAELAAPQAQIVQ